MEFVKNVKQPESYGSVPLSKLKRAIKKIEDDAKVYNITAEQLDEMPITFEYLIGSFFPEVIKNVRDEANKQYTKGYFAGMVAAKEKEEK